jgi:hypothetical protein
MQLLRQPLLKQPLLQPQPLQQPPLLPLLDPIDPLVLPLLDPMDPPLLEQLEPSLPPLEPLEMLDPLLLLVELEVELVEVEFDPLLDQLDLLLRCWSSYAAKSEKEKS